MNSKRWALVAISGFLLTFPSTKPVAAEDDALRQEAIAALRKAAKFYRTKVASHGGYVYYYSLDLQKRWGEGEATQDQIWVQPPGTPTVGMAFLNAYKSTGDRFYLDAARDAAEALVYGQLQSGGWTNSIDFNPRGARVAQYRNGNGRGKNNSTLDDGISQAAIRLLIHVDRALEFKHQKIHQSLEAALGALLGAQFPNGAFPQVWTGSVIKQPVVKANFPDYDWRTEGRIKNYWDMYTLNDNVAGTVTEMLIDAADIFESQRLQAALKRLGDFLILAQMPDPQPAWAQQYNYQMQPIWARRFEPAAISGSESQDVIAALMKIYQYTGDKKYLEPIPRALAFLKRSRLDDGRLARYYELKSNKPLYMQRRGKIYTLTYDDSNLPSHYGWKVASQLDELETEFNRLKRGDPEPDELTAEQLRPQVRKALTALDQQGRWISIYDGKRLVGQPKFPLGGKYISSAVFSKNVELLSRYLLLSR